LQFLLWSNTFCCLLFSSIFCFFEGRWICTIAKFRDTHVKNRRYFVRIWRWKLFWISPLQKPISWLIQLNWWLIPATTGLFVQLKLW
jgi:hypothetical protein